MTQAPELNDWIEREFAGYGRAIRRKDETPFPDEPYMSMADAKELTRRAVAAFAAAPSLSLSGQWQPISTAPKDGRDLLAISSTGNCWIVARGEKGHWVCQGSGNPIGLLTHWMPLPAAPPSAIPADEDISETSEGLPDPADRKP